MVLNEKRGHLDLFFRFDPILGLPDFTAFLPNSSAFHFQCIDRIHGGDEQDITS
jgi:hypothetical protein